jgi:tripartite-type tricarboxylate transporter receptor subunit TctC
MKLPRRQFLHLAAGAAALPTISRVARAQGYPSRPVRTIVGYPPGGATDAMARLVAQQLPERRQQFIVENRPGPGGNIGTEAVVRSQSDGYTLLLIFSANAINATFYDKLSFNFIRDIAPIASIARSPFVMEVHPSVPAKTVAEFIAYAKANPGKLRMASNGNGTTAHVAGELFKLMTGVDMVHVPYRGPEPALTDLLAGKVQVRFGIPSESIEYIRAGKLPVLAVTTAARSDALPDTPTVGEFVPGYEASAFFGIGAPKSTPAEIVEKLNREINAALSDPRIRAGLADVSGTVLAGTPADFGKLIADETEKWAEVLKSADSNSSGRRPENLEASVESS